MERPPERTRPAAIHDFQNMRKYPSYPANPDHLRHLRSINRRRRS